MLFSDKFEVDSSILNDYGAVNISLVCDVPLFVDPMLIFNSSKKEYLKLHKEIIKYFYFLAKKSERKLDMLEIKTWFTFKEVYNNWLGYALNGNRGNALDMKFGTYLSKNMKFALNTNNISNGVHIEKVMLLYDRSGKDKISDLTVNLIKGYLCEYTQKFAINNIKEIYCKKFLVDKAEFNYETESFITKEYYLPYIVNKYGEEEFILLTPQDILRKNEPAINRTDFLNRYSQVRDAIENPVLKAEVNNYIAKAVTLYEIEQKENNKKIKESEIKRIELKSFLEMTDAHPEIYDYYVKMRENDKDHIKQECLNEVNEQLEKLKNSAILASKLDEYDKTLISEELTAYEECKERIKYFKHIIEDGDAYKMMYFNGERKFSESDLQRMFKMVWCKTTFKADFEVNNGRGPADVVVSKGEENQVVVEFKLAGNTGLKHVSKQLEIYKKANRTKNGIIVIFYFTESEYIKVNKWLNENNLNDKVGENIFLIDCRDDNKESASKSKV